MKDSIYARAKKFSEVALTSHTANDFESFLVNAAISIELLGKAHLASKHPSLIADKDFDSLLHLCGESAHARKSPEQIRTIGARDTLARSLQILPALKPYAEHLGELADIRNGLVHMGQYDAAKGKSLFVPYLKASHEFLSALGTSAPDYFGKFDDLVSASIQTSTKAVTLKVESLLIKSRSSFTDRFLNVSDAAKKRIIDEINAAQVLDQYDEVFSKCPSCACDGILSGSHEVEWQADSYDENGEVDGASPTVTLYANAFECKICGLALNEKDELDAAKLDTSIELDDVDPDDFYEDAPDWGPDEDDER